MTKKIVFISLIITLLCCGCVDKKQANKYKEQGKNNAINYIEKKYGFKAKVIEINNIYEDTNPIPLTKISEEVIVKLEYKGKKFFVRITGSKSTTENGADNYQYNKINKDFCSMIQKGLPNHKFNKCEVIFNTEYHGEEINGMISNFYDDNNLSEIIDINSDINTKIYYNQKQDFTNINYKEIVPQYNSIDIEFYDFLTKQDYDKCLKEKEFNLPYINSFISYRRSNRKAAIAKYDYKNSLHKYNNIYIYGTKADTAEFTETDEVINRTINLSVSKSKTNWFEHKALIDTLSIKNSENQNYNINVYIPDKIFNKFYNKKAQESPLIMIKNGNCIDYSSIGPKEDKKYYYKDFYVRNENNNSDNTVYLSITNYFDGWYKDECH